MYVIHVLCTPYTQHTLCVNIVSCTGYMYCTRYTYCARVHKAYAVCMHANTYTHTLTTSILQLESTTSILQQLLQMNTVFVVHVHSVHAYVRTHAICMYVYARVYIIYDITAVSLVCISYIT